MWINTNFVDFWRVSLLQNIGIHLQVRSSLWIQIPACQPLGEMPHTRYSESRTPKTTAHTGVDTKCSQESGFAHCVPLKRHLAEVENFTNEKFYKIYRQRASSGGFEIIKGLRSSMTLPRQLECWMLHQIFGVETPIAIKKRYCSRSIDTEGTFAPEVRMLKILSK